MKVPRLLFTALISAVCLAAACAEEPAAGWAPAMANGTAAFNAGDWQKAVDAFHNTDLQAILQAHGVNKLAICGLQSEFCVDTTTRRALALGYPVTLVSDAHSTINNSVLSAAQITAHHNETLVNITSFGPRVVAVPSSEVKIDA